VVRGTGAVSNFYKTRGAPKPHRAERGRSEVDIFSSDVSKSVPIELNLF